MNKKQVLSITCCVFFAASFLFNRIMTPAQPGGASDPLVTKSYVDGQLEQIRAMLPAITLHPSIEDQMTQSDSSTVIFEVITYLENVYGELFSQESHTEPPMPAEQVPYEALFLETGNTLIAYSGTELILRGGEATAVTGINGLCNVTTGMDITNGMDIPLNHLLIVPASDGRGIHITPDAYIMIKGGYYLVNL